MNMKTTKNNKKEASDSKERVPHKKGISKKNGFRVYPLYAHIENVICFFKPTHPLGMDTTP